jgi:membrane protein DedA with SNARE-associated domain
VESILQSLAAWITNLFGSLGYAGILVCMGLESACIPLPSEVIMPLAGLLVAQGHFNLWLAALAGALGEVVGGLAAHRVGLTGGRAFIERYGRWILLSMKDLDRADRWFKKYGQTAIFTGRFLPIVRTFISLPAGIARMPVVPFAALTFAGAFPWCLALAWLGMKFGKVWLNPDIKKYFHGADIVIAVLVLAAGVYFFWHRIHELRAEAKERAARKA